MVINATVETENKTRTIKLAMQSSIGSRHPKTSMGMLAGNSSTKMAGIISSFQSKESNSMVAEAMAEYVLASTEAAYEDPWNRCQWDSWCQEGDLTMEILLTGCIKNDLHFPTKLSQRIPTGIPRPCV